MHESDNVGVVFDAASLRRFAKESHDLNPLHMDEDYARRSAFGQRVVFGALAGLNCLDRLPDLPGRELERIDLEFRHSMFIGVDYRLHVEQITDSRVVVDLRDGALTMVRLTADFRTAGAVSEAEPACDDFPSAVKPRAVPADPADETLRAGLTLDGFYSTRLPSSRFPQAQLLLRLCSYLTGMEAPGRRALFLRLTLQFAAGADPTPGRTVKYRLATRAYDSEFGLLTSALEVWTETGLLATGELKAFARRNLPRVAAPARQGVADDSLKGKTALVIGGSRGLGARIVEALAWRGCHVAVNFLSSRDEAEALAEALKDAPGQVLLLQGDARQSSWCEGARQQLLERFHRLDILVCNACTPPVSYGFSARSLAIMQRYVNENLTLTTTPLSAFLDTLAAHDGTVVGVSSSIVESDARDWPHYKSLKLSVETLLQSAAAEHRTMSFILARPPEMLTDMSNTPLRAARAVRPETVAGHVVEALKNRGQPGTALVLNAFPEMSPALPASDERIVVAATFTHDALRSAADHWRRTLETGAGFDLTPYNQLFQDLLSPQGRLVSNRRGLNAVLVRIEDWLRLLLGEEDRNPDRRDPPTAGEQRLLRETLDRFLDALDSCAKKSACPMLILQCPPSVPAQEHAAWQELLGELEADLARRAVRIAGIAVLRAADFHTAYGVESFLDPVRDEMGHIPYTLDYFNVLGTLIFRCYVQFRHAPSKVIVVDCDNTLWGGVCGEVGSNGVDIAGRFRKFQDFLVEQAGKGMLLCLCSKNNEEDVWAVFEANPTMPLKRHHIIDSRINWAPKSGNIRELAAGLNLGLDSVIFLDDSPLECAEVRAGCPEVVTIQWPQTDAEVDRHLDHLWIFDRFLLTDEDRGRNDSYRSQIERSRLRDCSDDFASFLRELGLQVDVRPIAEDEVPRVAQLTQRTNQFNFTTIRKTVGEVRQWLDQPSHECWTVTVSDRFGDYGLVGVVMARTMAEVLEVETFLLSCRVLGRGVEHRILARLGEIAGQRGSGTVRILFQTTAKNRPARAFLESVVPQAWDRDGDTFAVSCPAGVLAGLEFRPADGPAADADEERAPVASVADPALVRKREALLAAIVSAPCPAALPEAAPQAGPPSSASGGLRALFARQLGVPADHLADDEPLETYGMDSLRIVELTVELKRQYPDLPVTFLFEHKTLRAIADYLADRAPRPGPPPQAGERANTADGAGDIAIIGMNGRFPGAADLRRFWENLKAGRCSIGEIPPDRWEVDAFFGPMGQDNKSYTRSGGFLRDIDRFDPTFFRISPREAELMDPQQRLMLESVWGLLEDAGYTRSTLDRDTGVFIGALANDYGLYANAAALTGGGAYRNADFYQIPNRISYFFDLHGPSLSIDTACSASGTGLYFACQSLRAGDCGMAIVGGINLFLHPSRFIQYAQMRMISPTSTCSPFGAEANGTIFGEGVGTLLLKPLARAVRDGDNIHGVIKGCAVNSGGKTNGFTVPDPQAQGEVIARALRQAGVDSDTITYVEAHGTGTPLGDPIEVRGLTKAFAETSRDGAGRQDAPRCALGTVKANIGHLESGAAMAGIIKTLLQMKHRTLVPSLHAQTPNPAIAFQDTPFEVQQQLSEWRVLETIQDGRTVTVPRRAGISNFGAGGSNAHIVLEEYIAAPRRGDGGKRPRLIVLSAHKAPALAEMVGLLAAHLETPEAAGLDLADIAFTLQVGREALSERLALVADSVEETRQGLQDWLSGGADRVIRGCVTHERGKSAADHGRTSPLLAPTRQDLTTLARSWVHGGEIDWPGLHASEERRPVRVSLPTYPFGGGRYWLAGHPNMHLSGTATPSATPSTDVIRRTIPASDPVVRDHVVQGVAILPGVGYIEAALRACGIGDGQPCVVSRVVWSHPLAVPDGGTAVDIRLKIENDVTTYAFVSDPAPETTPHSQGTVRRLHAAPAAEASRISPDGIRARCPRRLDKPAVYDRFRRMGITYGAYFQAVKEIHLGDGEALGVLRLPGERGDSPLHPALMDGALQTALALGRDDGLPLLPFALDEMTVLRPLPNQCFAYARQTGESGFEIQVTDRSGTVCVTLRNLVLRERRDPLQSLFYLPRWTACGGTRPAPATSCGHGVLILRSSEYPDFAQAIAGFHRDDHVCEADTGPDLADAARLDELIAAMPRLDRIYFLGGLQARPADIADIAVLERSQEEGVLSFFRLVKALNRSGLSRNGLDIRVVTSDLYGIAASERPLPYAASLVGLAKVVAKEFPRLEITGIDLGSEDLARCASPEDWAEMVRRVAAEPANRGEDVVIRDGIRYLRTLEPLRLPPAAEPPFRDGGVYLILGGAGGLGLALSRHLARAHRAKLVWIGRSAENDGIRERMNAVRGDGGEVLYAQADATDAAAIAAAVQAAKARFGGLHGAVHSAIVLDDRTIANMDETAFRRALDPKTRGSVALYAALRQETLDFLLFFSSINSFQASMGQGNYVAGCHFKDAFGQCLNRLDQESIRDRVRIINWGYWGSVGIVASADYRERLAAEGHGSIEPAEGVEAVTRVLAHPLPQVVAMKADTARQRDIGVDPQARVDLYRQGPPAVLHNLSAEKMSSTVAAGAVLRFQSAFAELERLGRAMLVDTFRRLGAPLRPGERHDALALRATLGIAPDYHLLYDALLDILRDSGVIRRDEGGFEVTGDSPEADAAALERSAERLAEDWPEIRDRIPLLLACYRAWPEVLTGRRNHMEVLFPRGDLSLVQRIYAGNEITDACNIHMAELVGRTVRERLARNPAATVTILEVGAGTGGTSAHVLKAVAAHPDRVRYVYTDVSVRFLREGQDRFGALYPFTEFRLLDFEKDPAAQGLTAGAFDLVLGTNCVHACKNIGAVLARIKSLLGRNGVLLLNEFTSRLDYNTLTFGLTGGWWQFEDGYLRIRHSPLLDQRGWTRVLENAGFRDPGFATLPPTELGGIGQHVIACESDGVVCHWSPSPGAASMAAEALPRSPSPDAAPMVAEALSDPMDRFKEACRYVKGVFSGVLKMPEADIDDGVTFDKFGIDSLISMTILYRLEEDFGPLSSTLLFEYMTVAELARYFIDGHPGKLAQLTGTAEAAKPPAAALRAIPAPAAPPMPVPAPSSSDIAIIGIAGRYPGAGDLAGFWENLKAGRNCVGEVPAERWHWRDARISEAGEGGRWGGFIADVDKFDSLFFSISPREAEKMDPQERLFLETVWQAFEHAGYTPKRLGENQKRLGGGIGVFVGCMYQQYHLLAGDPETVGALSSSSYWSVANRVSYFFDLHGPSMAIDTACSSSLTAIHLACESIRRGESILAVAGGVSLTLHPGKYRTLQQLGMLATTPESRSLGDGDGLIPAEGVGAAILKPLDRAIADRDPVLGVIKGSAINSGGRTGGFTVPNPNAQAELIAAALERSGIDPETIGYVEVAANGSALGDPIEITGMTKAFRRRTGRSGYCPVGTVKSNLGHPEAVSGMAQLTKVLLQLKHRTLVPSLNASPLNSKLHLEDTPFHLQRTLSPWLAPTAGDGSPAPRRAAISSFGAGGANAHLIVEEPPAVMAERPLIGIPRIIVLSARNEERLAERARDLLDFLRAEPGADTPAFADVAYTLQTGREAMAARLAFVARDARDAVLNLDRYRAEHDGSAALAADGIFLNTIGRGQSPLPDLLDGDEGRDYLAKILANGKHRKIAQLWTLGLDIDWEAINRESSATAMPRRCPLPGYPFARIRHWISDSSTPASQVPPPTAPLPSPAPVPVSAPAVGGSLDGLRRYLRDCVAEILAVAVGEIDFDVEMREYGLDSINLAQLTTAVNAHYSLDVTVDLFFGHPTIEQCARFLWTEYGERLGSGQDACPAEDTVRHVAPAPVPSPALILAQPPAGARPVSNEPIAIVGMSAMMPQSDELSDFWQHLMTGRELIEDIPEDRLQEMGTSYQGLCKQIQTPTVRGSFLGRVAAFDSLFFGISPREAQLMDPQQRLLLETVWKTIEDAGYPASDLAGSGVGVFVGVSNHDYGKLYQRMQGQPLAHASTGMMVQSILANRVSYLFDFHGPSEIIDTACSSSTVALHRAVKAIRDGDCDAALVGGVNVLLDWHGYAILRQAGILSTDGKVRLFSRDGTGYVRGEGVAAVLLKPLARAIADRDHIYAVIRGSATSFDGKTYSMTAPSPVAQAQVVVEALTKAEVSPADICHIEAQGTGSPLGDPVEINAFKSAFRTLHEQWGLPMREAPLCGIGYLKPQIGHLEAASGMAGLVKILLAMKHGTVPGTRNLEEREMPALLNGSPFYVTGENRPWRGNGARRCAGLHSFGLGGVNAHVVLEDYV